MSNIGLTLNTHYLLFDEYYDGLVICKSEENFIWVRDYLLGLMINDNRVSQFSIPLEMTATKDKIIMKNNRTNGRLEVRIASQIMNWCGAVHCIIDEDINTNTIKQMGITAKEFYSLKI